MRLSIENGLLIDSKDPHEAERVLECWAEKHSGKVIYAYEWEQNTYYDDWVAFLSGMMDSDEEVNLLTKPEVRLKQEMRESVLSYCGSIKEHLPAVIENLFGTHPETEEKKLAAFFEGMDYLISSASLLNMDADLKDRHAAVVELSEAYESRDFVELADLLKYDWLPWVRQYEGNLQKIFVGM